MKPFVETQMSAAQFETLAELDRRVQKIPDDLVLPPSIECVTCHMVASALFEFEYPLKLNLEHGWFAGANHSWLTDDTGAAYDAYSVGIFPANGHQVLFFAPRLVAPEKLFETVEQCKRRFRVERRLGNCPIIYNPRRVKSPCKRTPAFRKAVRILVEVMK